MNLRPIKSWSHFVGLAGLLASFAAGAEYPARSIFQYDHKAWTHAQGAPHDVYAIARGTDGYLWLGTEEGLFRFDGVDFEAVRSIDGQDIPNAPIYYLPTAPDGAIWLRLGDGIARLDGGRLSKSDTSTWPSDWRNLVIDKDGVFWLYTRAGALWRSRDGKAERIGSESGFRYSKSTRRVFVDRVGGLWVVSGATSDGGLAYLPRGATTFVDNPTMGPTAICEGSDGTIWFTGPEQLTYISAGAAPNSKLVASAPGPSNICMGDRDGGVWVGYNSGLAHIGSSSDRSRSNPADRSALEVFYPQQGLSNDVIFTIFEDREGNVWTGTTTGLDRFRKTVMVPVALPRRSFSFALAPGDDGAIWAANFNQGLLKVDGTRIVDFPEVGPAITTIYRGVDGTIWVGSVINALWRSNAGGGFDKVPIPKDFVYDNLSGFTQDRAGTVWLGFPHGVAKLVGGKWAGYSRGEGIPDGYEALAMLTDRSGQLWLGGRDDIRVGQPGNFRTLTHANEAIPKGETRLIYERGGHIWIATPSAVALWDGSRFHELKDDRGQSFVGVSGIIENKKGELWIQGKEASWRIGADDLSAALPNLDRGVSTDQYDESDGLKGESVPNPRHPTPRQSIIEGTDGRLWFSTNAGLAWLDPTHTHSPARPLSVTVRSIVADGHPLAIGTTVDIPELTRRLEVRFSALDLGTPEKVRFHYRLVGADPSWIDTSGQQMTTYTNLGPGGYTFEIAANTEAGPWGSVTRVELNVARAWFQAYWFYALCLFAFLALLWALHRFRIGQLKGHLRLEMNAKQAERERIARDLHDTLLQSVQGLMLRFQVALEEFLPGDVRRSSLESALDRADAVIVEGRNRLSHLRNESGERGGLELSLERVGRDLAEGGTARFAFACDTQLAGLDPFVVHEAIAIMTEALTNAFRHSQSNNVMMAIRCSDGQLVLSVEDDGIGVAANLLAQGRRGHWGIQGMRERARLIGGELTISSREPEGTRVQLRLRTRGRATIAL